MEAVEFEVTVIVATLTTPTGVPVMVKSLEAVVVLLDVEKKVVEVPSGAAETAIVTPLAGMVDVIVTVTLKGARAGACVLFIAGLVVTASVASGVLLLPPPPQPMTKGRLAMTRRISSFFPANRCFIK